jgi:NTP pyrophosphatase (non-canonical NTP hydrolase)
MKDGLALPERTAPRYIGKQPPRWTSLPGMLILNERGKRTAMEDILARLRTFRETRDWARFHTPKDLAISIAIEAAELLEVFQWSGPEEPIPPGKLEHARQEAADIFIYLLYFCDRIGIDLQECTNEKISGNEDRYPVEEARGVAGRARRRVRNDMTGGGPGGAEI